jgi:hypothetical protein
MFKQQQVEFIQEATSYAVQPIEGEATKLLHRFEGFGHSVLVRCETAEEAFVEFLKTLEANAVKVYDAEFDPQAAPEPVPAPVVAPVEPPPVVEPTPEPVPAPPAVEEVPLTAPEAHQD